MNDKNWIYEGKGFREIHKDFVRIDYTATSMGKVYVHPHINAVVCDVLGNNFHY